MPRRRPPPTPRILLVRSCSPQAIGATVARIGPTELVLIRLTAVPVVVEPYQRWLWFRPTAWEDIQGPEQACTARAGARCCRSYSAAGTQGSWIKLGDVDARYNRSLNDCKFGLADLLNPCIFRVPVRCKSQTFSIFFIWFQKTVSVLKTSLWKMLVYPAVLFYLGWLHN